MRTLRLLYRGEAPVDFPRLWRRALVVSATLLVIGIGSFALQGLNLGLDFEGGTSYEIRSPGTSVADAREVVADLGASDARIQLVDQDVIRIRSDIDDPTRSAEIRDALSSRLGPIEAFEQVGPTWGADVTDKAVRALVVFFAVVALYLTIRLEWKMALGALVAVAHDIVVSVGFYSLFQLEITPATVIAFLTIMGYSLYDTIVVYDKVREVTGRLGASERYSYTELMNLALNRVTMRSINTSVSSALPVVSLLVVGWLIMGASALQEFGVALLVGIIIGSYSSLFLASAMVAALKEREPRWLEVTAKLDQRGVGDGPTRTVQREDAAMSDSRSTERVGGVRGPARRRPQATAPTGGIPPRPRKKRR
ncbi:MAG: protein translocase subunit SecF [Acidimicrobiales bacterium]|nr:protein translocase subunit SecF [Acidimicrobiales bacterium]